MHQIIWRCVVLLLCSAEAVLLIHSLPFNNTAWLLAAVSLSSPSKSIWKHYSLFVPSACFAWTIKYSWALSVWFTKSCFLTCFCGCSVEEEETKVNREAISNGLCILEQNAWSFAFYLLWFSACSQVTPCSNSVVVCWVPQENDIIICYRIICSPPVPFLFQMHTLLI